MAHAVISLAARKVSAEHNTKRRASLAVGGSQSHKGKSSVPSCASLRPATDALWSPAGSWWPACLPTVKARQGGEIVGRDPLLLTAFSQEQQCGPCTTASLDPRLFILALRHPACAPIPVMFGHCDRHMPLSLPVCQHQHRT